MRSRRFLVLTCMVVAAAGSRVLPHPPNFSGIPAMALFAGACFSGWPSALAVPIASMALGDVLLALLVYGGLAFAYAPFVYASTALTVLLGRALRGRRSSATAVGLAMVLSALVFFAVTNLGVWLDGRIYPMTAEGLLACYLAALPFLENMLLGNVVFGTVLFGGLAVLERRYPQLVAEARA